MPEDDCSSDTTKAGDERMLHADGEATEAVTNSTTSEEEEEEEEKKNATCTPCPRQQLQQQQQQQHHGSAADMSTVRDAAPAVESPITALATTQMLSDKVSELSALIEAHGGLDAIRAATTSSGDAIEQDTYGKCCLITVIHYIAGRRN